MPTVRSSAGAGRLLFAMDATASREPSWDQACHLQAEMFGATDGLGGLEVQLVFLEAMENASLAHGFLHLLSWCAG